MTTREEVELGIIGAWVAGALLEAEGGLVSAEGEGSAGGVEEGGKAGGTAAG